jgi:uncharacterized membrane protein (DUF106 family)
MRREIVVLLIVSILSLSVLSAGGVEAQGENTQAADVTRLVRTLDTSISSLRRGDMGGARSLLEEASSMYEVDFSPKVENQIDNRIRTAFISLKENPVEEDIFALRATILQAFSLPPLYAYSMFVILGVVVAMSLFITLVSRHLIDWERYRKNKAEISKFQKELREAMKKKDAKEVHKLQQRQSEIMKLQSENLSQNLKPTIVYSIPLIVIYFLLANFYSGWVVAWLPFSIDLPIFGRLVAFGFGWWYFITFFGLSQIFRKIMIRD